MISVVIRNKNQDKALTFLLKNLTERYLDDIGEILVIDNLSTDSSEAVSKEHNARFVTIKEFSYGGSANFAAEQTKFPIVVMFSAHSYPESHDFFKLIKQKFDENSNLAGLRCLHNINDYQNYINKILKRWNIFHINLHYLHRYIIQCRQKWNLLDSLHLLDFVHFLYCLCFDYFHYWRLDLELFVQ